MVPVIDEEIRYDFCFFNVKKIPNFFFQMIRHDFIVKYIHTEYTYINTETSPLVINAKSVNSIFSFFLKKALIFLLVRKEADFP